MMAGTQTGTVLAAATALLLLSAAPTPSTATCSFFETCADCACSTAAYAATDECKAGCAWVPSTGSCVTAQQANESGITAYTSLFPGGDPGTDGGGTSKRNDIISKGLATCPLAYAGGAVFTVVLMLLLTVAFMAGSMYQSCMFRKRQSTPLPTDTAWLEELLLAHLPPDDTLQWRGVATKAARPGWGQEDSEEDVGWIMCLVTLFGMGVPTVVWLVIGLPYSVQSDWGFNFYFPIYLVGGLAFLVVGVWLLIMSTSTNPPKLRAAYALTDKHAVIVKGDVEMRQLGQYGSVSTYDVPDPTVGKVAVHGNNTVVFGAAPSAGPNANVWPRGSSHIAFADLEDTGPLYRLLMAWTSSGTVQATKVSAGDSLPVPVPASGRDVEPPSGYVTVDCGDTLAPAADC